VLAGTLDRFSGCARPALAHQARDDVLAEVVVRVVGEVLFQQLVQVLGIEHVDAHAAQRAVGLAGHGGRVGAFSRKAVMRPPSMCITPSAVASMRGTSMQPTVHLAPLSTWSSSISE
jgi:hypothetical protein